MRDSNIHKINNYTPLPVNNDKSTDDINEVIKRPKGNTKRRIFKVAIMTLIISFVVLIILFLRVELMKTGEVIHDNRIFKTISDESYDYLSSFDKLSDIKKDKLTMFNSNKCNDKFIKNFYLKTKPCFDRLDSEELIELIQQQQKQQGNINEVTNTTYLLSLPSIKKDNNVVNLSKNGYVEFTIFNQALLDTLVKYKPLSEILPSIRDIVNLIWISDYKQSMINDEIYLEDRLVFILSHNDNVRLDINHMMHFERSKILEGYSDIKGDFINNYEYSEVTESNIKLEDEYHKYIEPLIVINNDSAEDQDVAESASNNKFLIKLMKNDIIYIPAFYSSKFLFENTKELSTDGIKLLTIAFNSRSRFLSTLIQVLFNNSD